LVETIRRKLKQNKNRTSYPDASFTPG
jgi:hypothetical protein